MKSHKIRVLFSGAPLVFALAGSAMAGQASPVKAPPLPPGSNLIQVGAGVTPEEVSRQKRAHKHSKLEKKDYTHDDSLDALPAPQDPNPKKTK